MHRSRYAILFAAIALGASLLGPHAVAQQSEQGWSDNWGYGQGPAAPGPVNPNYGNPYSANYGAGDAGAAPPSYSPQQNAPPYSQPDWRNSQPDWRGDAHESMPPSQPNRPPQGQAGAPRVITVPSARVGSTVVLGGTVVPYNEVTMAAELPGRIEYVAGTEGDWFEEGELLVAIEDDDLLARRRQALAELQNMEAALSNAQVQYSRELWAPQSRSPGRLPGMGMPNMFDQMFTRQFGDAMGYGNPGLERSADLYSFGSQVSQAQARMAQARSALEEIEAKLRDARTVAPFQGVITRKLVEVGDTVQPGQPMLHYADTRYLQLQVDVPARLVSGLELGMIVPARLDIGDTRVDARVAQIFPIADPQRHTVTVKLDLPIDTPGGPGMYAEVLLPDVNASVRNLPVIPYSAVVWRGSLPAVFVLNENQESELRMVRLGEAMGNRTVAVLSGLRPGERIIVDPPPGMASGWGGPAGPGPGESGAR